MTSLQPKGRLASLDALRGFDMLFIAGLAYLIRAVCSQAANHAGLRRRCITRRGMD